MLDETMSGETMAFSVINEINDFSIEKTDF